MRTGKEALHKLQDSRDTTGTITCWKTESDPQQQERQERWKRSSTYMSNSTLLFPPQLSPVGLRDGDVFLPLWFLAPSYLPTLIP